jgi:CheY-like chemotaxis protein
VPDRLIRPSTSGETIVFQHPDDTGGVAVLPRPRKETRGRRPGVILAAKTPLTRVNLSTCLQEAGFDVWAVESGVELFITCIRHRENVDILFVEADLPDLPAPALLDRLQKHLPDIPCCFFTRTAESHLVAEVRDKGGTVVIWPVPMDHLADTLWAEVLAASAVEA